MRAGVAGADAGEAAGREGGTQVRVVAQLAPGRSGVLQTQVTARGLWTPYVRLGDVFALGCLAFVLPMLLPLERWFPKWSRIGLLSRPPLPHRP